MECLRSISVDFSKASIAQLVSKGGMLLRLQCAFSRDPEQLQLPNLIQRKTQIDAPKADWFAFPLVADDVRGVIAKRSRLAYYGPAPTEPRTMREPAKSWETIGNFRKLGKNGNFSIGPENRQRRPMNLGPNRRVKAQSDTLIGPLVPILG